GACVHCKSLKVCRNECASTGANHLTFDKVKCEFKPGESICRRCQAGGHNCLARTRKKRKPAPTHEDLQARAHHQDLQIQQLLLQFDKLRADSKIQESITRVQSIRPPDIRVENLSPPDIVKYCELYAEEIMYLFQIFFDRINPFFSILDPELHTPQNLIWTCPFLFTVICAVASRYYEEKPTMYLMAMEFARDAAGWALIDGSKSVDVCQAYLLMAVYPIPKKKWAEDRSWLLMGVAIRMAIELELNQPPPDTCSEREKLNRTRTWLNCYCVDGSHAIQFGKMPMLRLDDYLARHSREWYRLSMTLPYDVHLCAYVHIIIIVAEFRATMTNEAESQDFDVVSLALRTEARLSHELSGWVEIYAQEFSNNPLQICLYRGNTTQMITAYLRLVVLTVGFQHAVKSELSRNSQILQRSIKAAREVIQIMAERLFPTGNLRFAMGANFLYVSFAAAFLINLLRPTLLRLLDEKTQYEIVQDVQNLIGILGTGGVAIDARHTPALYCRFLSSLLAKHHPVSPQTTSESPISDSSIASFPSDGQFSTSSLTSWPDIMYDVHKHQHDSSPTHEAFFQDGEVDMDLSLSHFVRTVNQGYPTPPDPTPYVDIYSSAQRWDFQGSYAAMSFADLWRT
ncbi:Protein priB, partial [Termitomyces sp. J132]